MQHIPSSLDVAPTGGGAAAPPSTAPPSAPPAGPPPLEPIHSPGTPPGLPSPPHVPLPSPPRGADLAPSTLRRRWIALCFGLTFLVYAVFIPRFVLYSSPPTGDQPIYLMA